MKVAASIAQMLKAEGVEYLFCFPVNALIDECARVGIRPIILLDVCGTLDPMEKWRTLAAAVDEGVAVSTVQQTLRMMLGETTNHELRAKITGVIQANLGEHAVELSAA